MKGQKRLALAGGALGVSLLQMRNELIADCHRIAKRFRRKAGSFHAREVEEVSALAERQDQLVVRQFVTMAVEAVRGRDLPTSEIDSLDRADERLHPLEQLAQRIDNRVQL